MLRRTLLSALALLIYGALLTAASLLSIPSNTVSQHDKLLHLLAYAGFALLASATTRQTARYAALCLGIISYGLAVEWLQSLTPSRTMSLADAAANTAGVALVFAAVTGLRQLQRR